MVANAGIRVPGVTLIDSKWGLPNNLQLLTSIFPVPEEEFDKVMSVNCKGTLYCYRAAARQMIKQGPERGGRIIGASSVFGLRGLYR